MEENYDKNDPVVLMGALKFNLLSLEFLLRFYLLKDEGKETEIGYIEKLKVGNAVKINSFTDYASLGQLIDRYDNKITNSKLKLDKKGITDIRDTLSHGRLFQKETKEAKIPFTIYKFSKPKKGNKFVDITYKEVVNVEWLSKNIDLVHKAITKVQQAYSELK